MLPYFNASLEAGSTTEQLLEILELFFISINMDSDLYPGVQQGDNGQSMVLGGYDLDGTCRFNKLSELCMQASLDLSLIDPKINLRVNKTTPDSLYALGTKLTKQGLGFPQYLNDDVIIPGLIKLGYRPEDAANYAVAACWEPIIPGYGADVPNETAFSYPMVLSSAIESLEQCENIETLLEAFDAAAKLRCDKIISETNTEETYYFRRPLPISPLISLMMDGCLESRTDIGRFGARYYNCGAFGAGLSTAVDSVNAI
jgi:formate C-acetyltransferase